MSLRKGLQFFAIISLLLLTAGGGYAKNIDENLKISVSAVETRYENGSLLVRISADKSLNYTSYLSGKPYRLVLEFPATDFKSVDSEKNIDQGIVKGYKITNADKADIPVSRMEILFSEKPSYSIDKSTNSVDIKIAATPSTTGAGGAGAQTAAVKITNLLFSGENNKFMVVMEATGKPEFVHYVLNKPSRLVIDVQNANYVGNIDNFKTKSSLVKTIRAENYPNLARFFIDFPTDNVPNFITKAEADKLIVELTSADSSDKNAKISTLNAVDFAPTKDRVIFRFKGVSGNEYKVLKLKDNIIVFDIMDTVINKDIQKTYEVGNVSDIVNNFTMYQVKPAEENKVRFVADLKTAYPYVSRKDGNDIYVEFFKDKPLDIAAAQDMSAEKKQDIPAAAKADSPKTAGKSVKGKTARAKFLEKMDAKKVESATEPKVEEKPQTAILTLKPKEDSTKGKAESKYKGTPITITLKDADIDDIFKIIKEVAKRDGETLNIVKGSNVGGKISLQLEEAPWDQVLDLVMETQNLAMKRVGNIVRIMQKSDVLKEEQDLLTSSKLKAQSGNLELVIVPLNYVEAPDYSEKVKALLSPRGSVVVDKRNNSLMINDLKDNIEEAKKLIAKVDTPPLQVVIEARVVEATSNFQKELGIQWGFKANAVSNSGQYNWGVTGGSDRGNTSTGAPTYSGVGGTGGLEPNISSGPLSPTGKTTLNQVQSQAYTQQSQSFFNSVDGATTTADSTIPVPYYPSNLNTAIPYLINLPAAYGKGVGGAINFAFLNLARGMGLDLQLSAMETKGMGRVLSRPKITTLNNVEAKIQQGSSIPYTVLSDKGPDTKFIDATLELSVTPRISPDNSLSMKVKVTNNNPNTALRSKDGTPSIDKNEATTEVFMRDGQSIVIGGIIRTKEGKTKDSLPYLGDIPVLGYLFRHNSDSTENRELLIFLTPRIIRNIAEVEASL